MYYTSPGQENREIASFIYKNARKTAEAMVKAGMIPAAALKTEFAKMVAKGLKKYKMPVPKGILANLPATPVAKNIIAKVVGAGGAVGGGAVASGDNRWSYWDLGICCHFCH